jgi:hypothetical protein
MGASNKTFNYITFPKVKGLNDTPVTSTHKFFIEAKEIATKHNADVEVIPFDKYSHNPKFRFALRVIVDRVGITRRERMSHPLGGELVSAFPCTKTDEEGYSLRVKDDSDSAGRYPNKKIYTLNLR